jgi:hypothetical protein
MIFEFLFCLQEAPHARFGLSAMAEQAAIRARYRRCRPLWDTHLAICKNIVREAALSCLSRRSVAVLGSGLLWDVPIDDLCQLFDRVVLIDLHHPKPARQAAKRHPNLVLRADDVTRKGFWESLPDDIDFLVSLNLAAQLALREGGEVDVQSHLDHLRRQPGVRLMISEWKRIELGEDLEIVAEECALPLGADFDQPQKNWKWYLAPPGELAPYRGLALEVGAWIWRD